jgi:ABC-type transport system involved in cytochrome c biogenesis permease subunit
MTVKDTMDVLGAIAVILLFLGVIAGSVMAVQWWDETWQIAVEPTRANVYAARLGPSHCLQHSWWSWRESGCRLI